MKRKFLRLASLLAWCCPLLLSGCVPHVERIQPELKTPEQYPHYLHAYFETSKNSAKMSWRDYFADPNLLALVDEALENNQELRILMQEIEVAKSEATAKSGAYLPSVELGVDAELDKVGEYTREGAIEKNHDIEEGKSFPDPLPNFALAAHASWELDIWKKLRNAEKSAIMRYLATKEGRKFMVTNIVAEIANSYFELIALDSQLTILRTNIDVQLNALRIVQAKKQGARVTELALRRFEAQLYKTKSLEFETQQQIIETENKINFLLGRYPQRISRSKVDLDTLIPSSVQAGLPSELLQQRPDVRQAELELVASDLDVEVARASFYPSIRLSGHIGYAAYDAARLIDTPESLIYAIGGSLSSPFINRREIEAFFYNANAKQAQAAIQYERAILMAFVEVVNELSRIQNLEKSAALRSQQVQALNQSIEISSTLFTAARADYMEVLLTQREALEATFELIEARRNQLNASVNVYRALGGGWTAPVAAKTDQPASSDTPQSEKRDEGMPT